MSHWAKAWKDILFLERGRQEDYHRAQVVLANSLLFQDAALQNILQLFLRTTNMKRGELGQPKATRQLSCTMCIMTSEVCM
jgi:hypothetical protein